MSAPRLVLRVLLVVASGLPGLLSAQVQRLANPGFDSNLGGWSAITVGGVSASWNPADASGNPASGSALLTHTGPGQDGVGFIGLEQCVTVTPKRGYRFSARVRLPAGTPAGVQPLVFLALFGSNNCTVSPFGHSVITFSGITAGGPWGTSGERLLSAFDTVGSIQVRLAVGKGTVVGSVPVSVQFDEVSLLETAQAGHHLSGSWYNPAWDGQGFFLDLASMTQPFDSPVFFGGWFTWTTTPGQRNWWTVQGSVGADVVTFLIYETRDGLFLDPRPVTTRSIGIGSIRFLSCTQAQVQIQLDGQPARSFPLARLTPVPAGCASFFP